ncbi:MAG: hypothetical protein KAR06_02875 [Deltaproteobacteria bacterium]|nr:hypothetical protein [Deltaproteobacteria bacterium]
MSQWTHVAGIIRLDNMGICIIRFPGRDELEKILTECIVEKLGKPQTFDGPMPEEKCILPLGSEGSVEYKISPAGHEGGMVWGNVSFYGDLRDFGKDDYPGLKNWFMETCLKFSAGQQPIKQQTAKSIISNSFTIRNAVLLVEIEFGEEFVLVWDGEKKDLRQLTV